MSLDAFIGEVRKGMSRTNRYEVNIPFPNTDTTGSKLVSLFCDATNLPGMNIATAPQKIFGEIRQIPYERMFDPVNLSFYVDGDMEVKAAFERWIHLIFNQTSRTINYYNNYVRNIDIVVKDVEDKTSYTLTLYEAYPKSIQTIQLSAESKDIMKMQVQMEYKYWTSSLSVSTNTQSTYAPNVSNQDPNAVNTSTGYTLGNINPEE